MNGVRSGGRAEFSRRAGNALSRESVAFVPLYFNCLLPAELFAFMPTYDIYPSLLPAFAGFGALEAARERGVRFLGATLHLAAERPDSGPIIAQVCAPICPAWPEMRQAGALVRPPCYLSLLSVELARENAFDGSPAAGTVRYVTPRPYTDRCHRAHRDPTTIR